MEFLENYELLLQSFWYTAIPVTLFFIIQTITTFFGIGVVEIDANSEGFDNLESELFSLRNLINFLLGFSWSGISLYTTIQNKTLLILVSVIIGILFVGIFFLVIKQLLKLNENNSFDIENTINKTGSVYLIIPENKSGFGKIQISINGSIHELQAITEKDKIETGMLVKILRIENNILIVEKI